LGSILTAAAFATTGLFTALALLSRRLLTAAAFAAARLLTAITLPARRLLATLLTASWMILSIVRHFRFLQWFES